MNFASITLFDYILLAVLIFFVVHGLWAGFLRQLPFVIALTGSYGLAAQYAGDLMPRLDQFTALGQLTESPKIVFGAGFLVLLIVLTLLLKLIGKGIGKLFRIKVKGWMNRLFLGAPLALAKAVVLVVLAVMFSAATLAPANHFFRDSVTTPYLEQGMDIARSLIRDAKIRKDLEPRQGPVEKKRAAEHEAVSPPSLEPPQPHPASDADDPASSTEVLTR